SSAAAAWNATLDGKSTLFACLKVSATLEAAVGAADGAKYVPISAIVRPSTISGASETAKRGLIEVSVLASIRSADGRKMSHATRKSSRTRTFAEGDFDSARPGRPKATTALSRR